MFGSHFSSILGSLFCFFGPLGLFGRVVLGKKEIWRGFNIWVNNESGKELEMELFWDPFLCHFRDRIAKRSFLKKCVLHEE